LRGEVKELQGEVKELQGKLEKEKQMQKELIDLEVAKLCGIGQ
jgi:hypothetical protein